MIYQRIIAGLLLSSVAGAALPTGQPAAPDSENGKNTYTDAVTGITLLRIPAGCFVMGSEEGNDNEKPVHEACVDEFYMGKYEVTQAQWQSIMGHNPSHRKGAKRPVEQVSWDDVQTFIRKLNQQSGQTYRLPTEAEWEYAARAGTTGTFHTGHCVSTAEANYNGDYPWQECPKGLNRQSTLPVGSLAKNSFGLYDMHGNVIEWCADLYKPYDYRDTPKNPGKGMYTINRVLRGGSWYYGALDTRSAFRHNFAPDVRSMDVGFRLAR